MYQHGGQTDLGPFHQLAISEDFPVMQNEDINVA